VQQLLSLTLVSVSLYLLVDGSRSDWPLLVTAVAGLTILTVLVARATRDALSPMVLIAGSFVLRVGLPASYVLLFGLPVEYSWLPFGEHDVVAGSALGCAGVTVMLIGWNLAAARADRVGARLSATVARYFVVDRATFHAAALGLITGGVFFTIFLFANFGNPFGAIADGLLRSRDLRAEGTSRYVILGGGLVVQSAVCLVAFLYFVRKAPIWMSLLPAVCATLLLSTLGGRVNALRALGVGLLLVWYGTDRPRRNTAILWALPLTAGLALLYAAFIHYYRGAGFTGGLFALSRPGFLEYLATTAWFEVSAFHPFAMASYLGAASIGLPVLSTVGGALFEGSLGAIRPGEFMVQEAIRLGEHRWGLHTGIVIDLYMGVGIVGMILGCLAFGIVLRLAYATLIAHPDRPAPAILYVLVLWNLFWVFWESLATMATLVQFTIPFLVTVFLMAGLVRRGRSAAVGDPLMVLR